MTDPLRIDPTRAFGEDEDMVDVLASIRRLIAQDDGPSGAAAVPAKDEGTCLPRPATGMPLPAFPLRDAAWGAAEQPRPLRLECTTGAESAGLVAFPSSSAPPVRSAFPQSAPTVTLAPVPQTVAAPARVLPLSPAGTAGLTASLSEAVGAAAARMAETARPAAHKDHAMPDDPAEPPFRLRPDALIPPALQAGPAQPLSPRPLSAQPVSPAWGDAWAEAEGENPAKPVQALSPASAGGTGAGAAAQSAASVVGPATAAPSGWSTHQEGAVSGPAGAAVAGMAPPAEAAVPAAGGPIVASDGYAKAAKTLTARSDGAFGGIPAAAEHAARWSGAADTQQVDTQPADTQTVGAQTVGAQTAPARSAARWADPTAPAAGTQRAGTAPSQAAAPGTTPATSVTQIMEHRMNAQPIRDLLREAIRDELRGEIGRQLDTDLRRLVREELAVALTEALAPPA